MNIKSSRPQTKAKPLAKISAGANPPEKTDSEKITDMIVKGAYGSGGAVAGTGLGIVTGGILANLTGTPSLTSVGGVLGAVGGAGTAVVMAGSENKMQALGQMAAGWGGAAAGAAAGQWVAGNVLGSFATAAGYEGLAAAAPFLGTAAGAIAGSIGPAAMVAPPAKLHKMAAGISFMGGIGLGVGTAAKAFVVGNSGLAHMIPGAPIIGTLAGAAIGNYLASENGDELANDLRKIGTGGALTYGAGAVVGGLVHTAGFHGAYSIGLPLAGALAGGLLGYSAKDSYDDELTKAQQLSHKAGLGILGGAGGMLVGDLVGQGLTALTGSPIYEGVGFALGATNGVLTGLEHAEFDTKNAAEIVGSGTAGVVGGALLGYGLTALTGNNIYATAGAAVGAINGGLLVADATEVLDTKGVAATLAGTTAGVTLGALLGATLDSLAGQSVMSSVFPILGAAAGGLSSLAYVRTKAAEGDNPEKS